MKKKKTSPKANAVKEPEDNVLLSAYETNEDVITGLTGNWLDLAKALDAIDRLQGDYTKNGQDALRAKAAIASEIVDSIETLELHFGLMSGIPLVEEGENPKMLALNLD